MDRDLGETPGLTQSSSSVADLDGEAIRCVRIIRWLGAGWIALEKREVWKIRLLMRRKSQVGE